MQTQPERFWNDCAEVMDKVKIIDELKRLCSFNELSADELARTNFNYEPFNDYLRQLVSGSKKESCASLLIHRLCDDVLGVKISPEVNLNNSFVDFALTDEDYGNPVFVELKPLHQYVKTSKKIKLFELIYEDSYNRDNLKYQIRKYLKDKNNEYVILTNLNFAWLFNREALVNYKPFKTTSFADLLQRNLEYRNFWDTVRRIEDERVKINLDDEFLDSLKAWFATLEEVNFRDNVDKEEKIVLLLNKIIFIKTLEDFGLISYKFLEDQYKSYLKKWKPKGYARVLNAFFREIEEFFEVYYDTELFNSNIWDVVAKDRDNVKKFAAKFESVLGLDTWSKAFRKGLIHYNYRQINEDIFGKAYERWIAEGRKDEGIYYTPATITEYMTEKLVDSLFDELVEKILAALQTTAFSEADRLTERLKSLRIIDPCAGSGSFLIKVLKKIYPKYEKIVVNLEWLDKLESDDIASLPPYFFDAKKYRDKHFLAKDDGLRLMSSIILNHVFAADKDEKALDTAKTNLWKEAIKINPAFYNYSKLDEEKVHILPNLELNYVAGDSLLEIDIEEQIRIISEEFSGAIARLFEILEEYLSDPFEPEIVAEAVEIKRRINSRLAEELPEFEKPLFFAVEFFRCYFSESGEPLPPAERGFAGVVSNPPWEAVKPVKKEFAKLGKFDMDILDFIKSFSGNLKKDPDFKKRWEEYRGFYRTYSKFLAGRYPLHGKGDPNYYKFYIEKDMSLLREGGEFCLLVPSGFQTDQGSRELRNMLIFENRFEEISSFENRGYKNPDGSDNCIKLFPEVDNRFKFSIVRARKSSRERKDKFSAKFYMLDPLELKLKKPIDYSVEMIEEFSPENLSIMEFRDERDYEICSKIAAGKKQFKDLGVAFRREFEISSKTKFLQTHDEGSEADYILIEGKGMYQYDVNLNEVRYNINTSYLEELKRREISFAKTQVGRNYHRLVDLCSDLKYENDYYRLVYRRVGRSTDERTLIATIIPPKTVVADSLNHVKNLSYQIEDGEFIQNKINYRKLLFLTALFNSLILNYYLRNKVSANLSIFFVYELPIAEANAETRESIARKAFSLLYRKSKSADFEPLRAELGYEVDRETPIERLRAEIETEIARDLYGLDRSDWDYAVSTFVFGGGDTRRELDEIIRLSKEIY